MKTAPRNRPQWLRVVALIVAVVAVIVVALGLALAMRDVVRQAIVLPMAYVAWLAGLVLNSIPQSTFWAIVLAAGILVALRSIGSARSLFPAHRTPARVADSSELTRLATRLAQFTHLDDSAFARERISFELRSLVVQVLAYRERLSGDDVERGVRSGTLPAPAEIRELLTDWQAWLGGGPSPLSGRPRQWLRRMGGSQTRRARAAHEQRLLRAIEYMEAQLNYKPEDGKSVEE